MKEEVKIFKALGDETRLEILILLSTRNICAKGIARHLGISEAAVSQHIKVLKESDLIKAYRRGYYVMYELNKTILENSISFINHIINKDCNLINKEQDVKLKDFNITNCNKKCKSINHCCKRIIKEE